MIGKTLKLALLITLQSLIMSCGSDQSREHSNKISSVVTIGDSISNGFGLATPWPEMLEKSLNVPFSNDSVSGMQTDWGLQMIDSLLDIHQPSHVLILLGSNDAARDISVDSSIANLQKMIDIATAHKVIALVGTVIPNRQSARADQMALAISRDMNNLSNAIIVDVRAEMGDGTGLLADGVHPNDAGQRVIAEAFLNKLIFKSKTAAGH